METESLSLWQIVLQGGAAGALFLGITALARGWFRTRQEVEVWQLFAGEQKARAERAEAREEAVTSALKELNATVRQLLPGGHER